jgi:hypothetical protein
MRRIRNVVPKYCLANVPLTVTINYHLRAGEVYTVAVFRILLTLFITAHTHSNASFPLPAFFPPCALARNPYQANQYLFVFVRRYGMVVGIREEDLCYH